MHFNGKSMGYKFSDADPDPPNLVSADLDPDADPDPGSLTIKIKSLNFSKNIFSISLISKSKILLIFKSEPKP